MVKAHMMWFAIRSAPPFRASVGDEKEDNQPACNNDHEQPTRKGGQEQDDVRSGPECFCNSCS